MLKRLKALGYWFFKNSRSFPSRGKSSGCRKGLFSIGCEIHHQHWNRGMLWSTGRYFLHSLWLSSWWFQPATTSVSLLAKAICFPSLFIAWMVESSRNTQLMQSDHIIVPPSPPLESMALLPCKTWCLFGNLGLLLLLVKCFIADGLKHLE